jgi:hypothetical protein
LGYAFGSINLDAGAERRSSALQAVGDLQAVADVEDVTMLPFSAIRLTTR